jgi:hypothetical protein
VETVDLQGNYDEGRFGSQFYPLYTRTEFFTSWYIPSPVEAGPFGPLAWTTRLAGGINYQPGAELWDPGELRRGFTAGFSHSFGFEQTDWIGNFRRGLSASAGNGISYNFSRQKWDTDLVVSATGYLPVTRFFGVSGRINYRQMLNGEPSRYYNGEIIRGVIDKRVKTTLMLSLNADFPFRVLLFHPSEWFGIRWMRFFDFEMHVAPIFDAALYRSLAGDMIPEFAAGAEVIVFPEFIRKFIIRASFAVNLKEAVRSGQFSYEWSISLDHHY